MLIKGIKRIFGSLLSITLIALGVFTCTGALGADTFTVALPANTEVTMGDPNAALPFTISNTGAHDIKGITFNVDSTKYSFLNSNGVATTVPPTGWCISGTPTAGSISFALLQGNGSCSSGSNGSQITPGTNETFNLNALPAAAAADVTGDTLTSVVISSFTLSGSLPAWTRRSLAATMSATPASASTGGVIALQMEITNRSSATQTTINSTPAPPTASNAIVTNTDGPFWGSTTLSSAITSSATTINAASTAEFSAIGTIKIDSEQICYTSKTATSFTGVTRGCNGTTAAFHNSAAAVYNLTPFSLLSGATGTLTWLYSADISGSVFFTARATNNSATAKSVQTSSNTVVIGNFTSAISLSPVSVISGQTVTVTMTAYNNGSLALINVTPSALTPCGGGASMTLASGPAPASITSIPALSSGIFQWTYTVTGTAGQTFCISGNANANGPVTSSTATSNTGSISAYSVVLTPSTIASGATNATLTWNVFNGGGFSIKEVDILTPAGGGYWTCGSVTAPAGWSGACAAKVLFTSNSTANDIAINGSQVFKITFSTTQTVASDTTVSFPVTIIARGGGGASDNLGSSLIVTSYVLTLTNSPAGPINADGSSRYTMTAVLASGGQFVSGKTVTFTATDGSLDPATAVTDVNGQASVGLVAPFSTVNASSTATATYLNATATDTVSFLGYTKPDIVYWGGLTPMSVSCSGAVSFQVTVKNIGSTAMTLTTNSYFAFNDVSAGGCSTYKAFLDSGSTGSIAAGGTKTLTFGSATNAGAGGGITIPATFITGSYEPVANAAPPPASGMFFTEISPPGTGGGTNDQYRTVTDKVTVGGGCNSVKINVIDWRELR